MRPYFYIRWYRKLVKKFSPQQYKQKYPRKVNLNDNLNKNIVLSIFPKYVSFKNQNGKIEEVEIFDFFLDKFNLGTGSTIPRLILIFLEKLVSVTSNYYMENQDQLPIKRNQTNCFEIIKNGFFVQAYEEFKDEIFISFSKLNPEFESQILLLKERLGNRYSFSAKELKGLMNFREEADLFRFCNYLLHVGLLRRTNSSSTVLNMKFELPIMFRSS